MRLFSFRKKKHLTLIAIISLLTVVGCDKLMDYPIITLPKPVGTNAWDEFQNHPFKVDPNFEKKFVYRRDNWHHHYYKDKDGNWMVEYVEKCPDKK